MKADIARKIDITNTFEQIVISENGKISMFSKVAENMMADYILLKIFVPNIGRK